MNKVKAIFKKIERSIRFYGNARLCPLCGKSSSKFLAYGKSAREDAQCPHCGSLERHRFLWLFLQKETNLFQSKALKALHVAPEKCLESSFKKTIGKGYLTADLFNPRAMVKMDITDINYLDETFDVIYCSHVLEHVVDDYKAIREFHRVLKSDGWAILLVPITREITYEDSSIIEPDERLKVFGQKDHVRCYGFDYINRLKETGFKVETFKVKDISNANDTVLMGLTSNTGDIYFCTKSM